MKNAAVCCVVVLFTIVMPSVNAGVPEWVRNAGRSQEYPDSIYLTGFGLSVKTSTMTMLQSDESALEFAKKNLIEKIRVKIVAVTSSKTEETSEKYSSFFSSAVQSTSSLDVDGLSMGKYRDGNTSYSFVYIKRSDIISTYLQKVKRLREELEGKLKLAQLLEQQTKVNLALREYISCYSVVRQLEEAQSISTSLQLSQTINELLNTAATNEITVNKIRETVHRLSDRKISTVDDLAWYVIHMLYEQVQTEDLPVIVRPLKYEDTQMGSSFSRYFSSLLEQKCAEVARWKVVNSDYDVILSGSYWQNDKTIKIIMTLRGVPDGAIVGSTELSVEKAMIMAIGRDITPANVQQAKIDQKIFATDEITNGGLIIEGWTNKTDKGNLFVNGEKMNVTIKVNMPCYIRFVYHMADGKRILLMNETYIDNSKVNMPYTLPNTFECSDPFGSEVLQIFARTEKYENVQTMKRGGYNYLAEDLNDFVAKTRGMKEVAPATMQAECRINITTMRE